VLGADAAFEEGNSVFSICVVMRGALWLDGVFVAKWVKGDLTSLAECLKASPYYGELTAIFLPSPLISSEDLEALWQRLKRPVALFSRESGNVYEAVKSIGLTDPDFQSLLKACSGPEGPEALRLARMLAPLVKELARAWKGLNLSSSQRW